ncbi:nitrite and sulfite reductase subunit [[Clostridium] sordellii]|uniref:4Fe-4S binding protein n=1 Tax=Paraclostridium sordellii TaxID=1505 RepID=UPI0005DB97FA|nr:4Fe-4S binding protein [Paeniclostridium sordellii]MBX9181569.1 4Fe-4S binding protein [Paeniclostridium sordellii]CEO14764.1 nitrite and sulfite reductase subunit [[Clostridium] sordellii] [Paeniclostridium sordellii]CEP83194.1 nitrite and sulfite reductase subunit [[Clostridium] sordellii] [Paeniclostridium sordellii]
MKITDAMRKEVKGQGFLSNNDGKHFSCRVITENGAITADQLINVAEIAKKYGSGDISLTSRLTLEIPGIKYEDIENTKEHLKKGNLVSGGTGSRVRPIVPCKGTVCTFGLCDTQGIGTKLHKEFYEKWYDVKLPHKFKIGVGGCPNNCIKPSLNDFGVIGQFVPDFDEDMCSGCKKCAPKDTCKVGAISMVDGKAFIDREKCNNCGLCIGKCHFDAIDEGKKGLKIYLGGKWGKASRPGTPISGIHSEEEMMNILEKTLLIYREQGKTGERFGDMIDRIGAEDIEVQVLGNEILERKEEILEAQLHTVGGATC